MPDLYLRAADEATLAAALPWLRGTDPSGQAYWCSSGPGWAFDLVGPVVTAPATVDANRNVVTPATVDGRCHANLRLDDPALVEKVPAEIIIAKPNSPSRIWA